MVEPPLGLPYSTLSPEMRLCALPNRIVSFTVSTHGVAAQHAVGATQDERAAVGALALRARETLDARGVDRARARVRVAVAVVVLDDVAGVLAVLRDVQRV